MHTTGTAGGFEGCALSNIQSKLRSLLCGLLRFASAAGKGVGGNQHIGDLAYGDPFFRASFSRHLHHPFY